MPRAEDPDGDMVGDVPIRESHDCPTCGFDALKCETTGEAHRGGGYHRRCPNGHEWDDTTWSYYLAKTLRSLT